MSKSDYSGLILEVQSANLLLQGQPPLENSVHGSEIKFQEYSSRITTTSLSSYNCNPSCQHKDEKRKYLIPSPLYSILGAVAGDIQFIDNLC